MTSHGARGPSTIGDMVKVRPWQMLGSLVLICCAPQRHVPTGGFPPKGEHQGQLLPTALLASDRSRLGIGDDAPNRSSSLERVTRDSPRLPEQPPAPAPFANRFESGLRSSILAARLSEAEQLNRPTLELRLALARELLAAGQPSDAIAHLERAESLFNLRTEQSHADYGRELWHLLAASWMRLGELENCVLHHGSDSCLIPLAATAQHSEPRGSQQALIQLRRILDTYPHDFEARWLYNIAAMTVRAWPDHVPPEILVPPTAFASEQSFPRFRDIAAATGITARGLAGGVCLDDFDGDGSLNLVISDRSRDRSLRFLKGDGGHHFADRTIDAGLSSIHGGANLVHADLDNDDDLDILVLRGAWQAAFGGFEPLSLLSNDGHGAFADMTEQAGLLEYLATQTAATADFDGDGWLDIFVGSESAGRDSSPCRLYRNMRDGRFRDVACEMGVDIIAHVKGCAWGDYDGDRDPDLILTRLLGSPLLYRNDGQLFTDVSQAAGVAGPRGSLVCWWFDYNNDGWLDLFVSGFAYEQAAALCRDYLGFPDAGNPPRLYQNLRDGTFSDVTREAGLWRVLPALSGNVGDFDNDGWTDFYLGTGEPALMALYPNRLFRNDGGTRFVDVTTPARMGHIQKCNAVAAGDVDEDGDQDVFAHMGGFYSGDSFPRALFENPGNSNAWVTLLLQGTKASRSAIGARILVRVRRPDGTSRDIHQLVGTGGSAGSQSLQVEIGLGDATAIECVEIQWPGSGTRQAVSGLPLRSAWCVTEPTDDGSAGQVRPKRLDNRPR